MSCFARLAALIGGLLSKLPSHPSFAGAAGINRHIGCLKRASSCTGRPPGARKSAKFAASHGCNLDFFAVALSARGHEPYSRRDCRTGNWCLNDKSALLAARSMVGSQSPPMPTSVQEGAE